MMDFISIIHENGKKVLINLKYVTDICIYNETSVIVFYQLNGEEEHLEFNTKEECENKFIDIQKILGIYDE